MPRVAIVTRVSTEEQTRPEYNSCQSQQDICRHYIEIQREKGWELYRVYEDAGYSGRSLKRPGIQALLRDVRRGLVDIVLCTRIDRLSRSIKDFYEVWTILDHHNVIFVSATESFDTSTAAGSLMVNLLLSFGAWEVAVVSERTSMKMLARARRGLWHGGHVPLGYDYDKERQLLVPNADEADVVHSIFEALVREGSVAGVRQFANEHGYRSKVRTVTGRSGETRTIGGKPFSYDLIQQIIMNPIYKGRIRCGDELFAGNHEALVPEELWELANTQLRQRVRGHRSPNRTGDGHVHLFKGLLRCGECGASVTPYPSGKRRPDGSPYLYYTCLSAIKDRPHRTCNVRSLPARAFEVAFIEKLEELAADPSLVEQCLVAGSSADRKDLAKLRKRLGELQSELADADQRMVHLLGVFEETEVVPEGLKTRCCELDEQRAGLRLSILQVQQELDDLGGEPPNPQEIADFLRDFTEEIRDLPLADKKARIRSVIDRITYNHLPASSDLGADRSGSQGALFRTFPVLVIARFNAKAPEQGCSGASGRKSHNHLEVGSGLRELGSPAGAHGRMLMSLQFSPMVRLGNGRSPHDAPPKAVPSESPAERAARFRELLDSGKYRSQSDLARALGCTQPWISKALRRLRDPR